LFVTALTLAGVATSAKALAETCVAASKPDARVLHDSGYSKQEIQTAFEEYFREAEDFLNCWNQVTFRVREEARAASNEYAEALRAYPANDDRRSGDGGDGGFVRSTAPLIDTGELVMDRTD